jgi:Tfp pilus assembly protein PilE
MRARLSNNEGFMLVDLVVATALLSIAILALMAVYDSAFMSLHKAAQKTAAATLAQNQLELYSALSYTSIGLDSTRLTAALADTTYAADRSGLSPAGGTNVTLASACSTTQCLPIQTLTGDNRKSYTVETFIRDVSSLAYSGRTERLVSIVVRDPSTTGTPVVAQSTVAFDAGPSTTTVTVTG